MVRESERYLRIGRRGATRPDPVHAAWLYGQMVRWRQAEFSLERLAAAQRVFRPDLYDAIFGSGPTLPRASRLITSGLLPVRHLTRRTSPSSQVQRTRSE